MNRRTFIGSCLAFIAGCFGLAGCSVVEQIEQDCKRCGKCCQLPEIMPNMWSDCSDLTDEQKKQLIKVRARYPKNKTGCDALIFEKNGLASCLIQKLFGYIKKPRVCKKYPKDGELCIYYKV